MSRAHFGRGSDRGTSIEDDRSSTHTEKSEESVRCDLLKETEDKVQSVVVDGRVIERQKNKLSRGTLNTVAYSISTVLTFSSKFDAKITGGIVITPN